MFAYMGGKNVHTKWISPWIPSNFKTYVEVFGGAMWVYWKSDKVPVETNIYNDYNRHLSNIFQCASIQPDRFREVLESYVTHLHNDDVFEEFKNEVFLYFDKDFTIPNVELAAKYMFSQTQTFAGNTNLNRDRKIYKSPDPKHKFVTYIEKFSQSNYLKKLERLSVENMDCRELIKKYDSEDTFFFLTHRIIKWRVITLHTPSDTMTI